jgi:hypothetical protein
MEPTPRALELAAPVSQMLAERAWRMRREFHAPHYLRDEEPR